MTWKRVVPSRAKDAIDEDDLREMSAAARAKRRTGPPRPRGPFAANHDPVAGADAEWAVVDMATHAVLARCVHESTAKTIAKLMNRGDKMSSLILHLRVEWDVDGPGPACWTMPWPLWSKDPSMLEVGAWAKKLRRRHRAWLDQIKWLRQFEKAAAAVHADLDAADVEKADGTGCAQVDCGSKLQHRVRELIQELEDFKTVVGRAIDNLGRSDSNAAADTKVMLKDWMVGREMKTIDAAPDQNMKDLVELLRAKGPMGVEQIGDHFGMDELMRDQLDSALKRLWREGAVRLNKSAGVWMATS